MSEIAAVEHDLDQIFAEVGEFGVFQIISYFLICIPNVFAATYIVNYALTANALDYRWVCEQCALLHSVYRLNTS